MSRCGRLSSTLIAGAEEAILVDTLVTLNQVDQLAEWVRGFDKRITGVYITHGHQDHWIGLARLQEHFPEARGIATPEVLARATFEATDPGLSAYWQASFPGELPEHHVLPEAMEGDEFEIEGHLRRAVSVGQGDTEYSTVPHVPSADAVIAGDVVYNGVHMMTAETDESTVRFAAELGYEVTLVKDAIGSFGTAEMTASLEFNVPAYASAIVSSDEIATKFAV